MARARPTDEQPESVVEPFDPDAGDLDHLTLATPDWRWTVYRKLRPEEKHIFPGQHSVLLCKLEGPVDLDQIRRDYGGGTYEFWGTIVGQRGLQAKPVISIAGELKPAATTPDKALPAVTVAAQPPTNGMSPELVALLSGQQRLLEAINARLAAPARAEGLGIKDLLTLMPLLRPPEPDPKAQVNGMLELVKTGIELGTQRDPVETEPGVMIWEKIAPSLERLATAVLTRRPGGPTPRPPARTAEATVVEPGGAAPPPSLDDLERDARLTTLVGGLARALAQGDPVQDFAETVERILPSEDVFMLKSMAAEDLAKELRERAGERYPALQTEAAQGYIAALLEELRNPTVETETD
jgi:hypothetical protein